MTLRTTTNESKVVQRENIGICETMHVAEFLQIVKDVKNYLIKKNQWNIYIYASPIIVVSPRSNNNLIVEEFCKEMEYTLYAIFRRGSGNIEKGDFSSYLESDTKHKKSAWWVRFNKNDINDLEKLKNVINNYQSNRKIELIDYAGTSSTVETEALRHYIIFWNLFLAAMDDDIYNEQLATVAELAACFGFDEPMMRDWCRAVEYVFAGNKLSEDCDLECETVEGARFFLHKEE